MPIFVFLHVLTMFVAVALAYGPAALIVAASRSGDVPTLRGVMRASTAVGRLTGPAFALGIVFGFTAVFVHGFDPLANWLVLAYVLIIAAIVMTVTFTSPWLGRVAAAAEASPDDAPSAELRELLESPRNRALLVVDALIIVALIADMVLKPIPGRLFAG